MPDTSQSLYRKVVELERQVGWLRRKGKASGWQLLSSFDMHRFGGGRLVWQFDGHSVNVGSYNTVWTETSIGASNYGSCEKGGGPFVRLDGTNDYLTITDASWQETGTEEMLVWGWAYPQDTSASQAVAAKYNTAGDQRSWVLEYDNGTADFNFICNSTGLAGGDVPVASTYGSVAVDNWYFVAGYYEANSLMRIYVGHEDDLALTVDSLAVGVPADLKDGTAPLTIGYDSVTYFNGRIGIVQGRANVPVGDIDDHVNMLFQATVPFYTDEHYDALLLEDGEFLLLENWQKLLLE